MTKKVELYTDGASRGNPGKAAIAYVMVEDGRIVLEHGEAIGRATNNKAEYKALIAGLGAVASYGADRVDVYMDSELVVRQMVGSYAVRAEGLIPLFQQANEVKDHFSQVTFTSVPRTHPFIRRADQLANEALDAGSLSTPREKPAGGKVKPIGVVRSPYREQGDAPRQGRLDPAPCTIEIFPEYEDGLFGIQSCQRLFILYWFDRGSRDQLFVDRPGRGNPRGVFATRSPNRPNPIGLTLVDLIRCEGRILHVHGLDALNGTPVLDIKPYSPKIDSNIEDEES